MSFSGNNYFFNENSIFFFLLFEKSGRLLDVVIIVGNDIFFFPFYLSKDVVAIDIYGEVKSVLICRKTLNVLNWITRYNPLIIPHNIVV